MRAAENAKKVMASALLLGVIGLITNLISYAAAPTHAVPLGNLFLFWSAAALGATGGAISAAVSVMVESLYTGEQIYALRVLALCCALGFTSTRFPRLPSYLVTATLWIFCFAPILSALSGVGVGGSSLTPLSMLLTGLEEVGLTIIAGLLLQNPAVWGSIAHRPRHVDTTQLLSHFLAAFSVGPVFFFVILHSSPSDLVALFDQSGVDISSLFALVVLAVYAPAVAGWWMSGLLRKRGPHSLLRSRKGLFGQPPPREEGWLRPQQSPEDELHSSGGLSAARQAERSESEWRAARNSGVCVLSHNGRVAYMNDLFKEMVGITRNEFIGHHLETLGLQGELGEQLIDIVIATGKRGAQTREVRVNHLPAEIRFFEVVTEKAGRSSAHSGSAPRENVLITIEEITDRRTVEAHLLQAQKVNALSNVVSGLSHAFNSALTSIVGQASFALHSDDEVIVKRSLDQIIGSANKASELVWKLIEYCEGRPELMRKNDLSSTVRSTLDLLEKIAGERYEIEFEGVDTTLGVLCDQNLIMQAISNLIINAKEAYQGQGGKIEINLDSEEFGEEAVELFAGARAGKYARLRVRDFGSGMTPDILRRACEPMFTTKKGSGQAGLGLSIVFSIARAHDGFLTLESHPDKGSCVSMYLPLVSLEKSNRQINVKDDGRKIHVRGAANNERILVVEDEPAIRELIARMLTELGYTVESCKDGEEALSCCSEHSFDLVLVDLMMPKINGTELLAQIKEGDDPPKTILMTGYGAPSEEANGTRVLPKPFDLQTLADSVYEVLQG